MDQVQVNAMDVSRDRSRGLLSLPAELRIHILEYVFNETWNQDGFVQCQGSAGRQSIILDDKYSASLKLQPLLACKQFYQDGSLVAMNSTHFIARNLFFDVPQRLSILHQKQIEAIRHVSFVADDRQFRKLGNWGAHPFGMRDLKLETLTIVLHRSSFWHYLFDFTPDILKLLRNLQGVRRFVILRNEALVKGSLKTWYNRLVGLILKEDHRNRYEMSPPRVETTWWEWNFDDDGQRIVLDAKPAKQWMDEEEYMQFILPLMEKLRESVESEEWNPDPRARNHYY